jgi:hypothetical protein
MPMIRWRVWLKRVFTRKKKEPKPIPKTNNQIRNDVGINKGVECCGNCSNIKFGGHDWCNYHECFVDIYSMPPNCEGFGFEKGCKKFDWGIFCYLFLFGISVILWITILIIGGEPF